MHVPAKNGVTDLTERVDVMVENPNKRT